MRQWGGNDFLSVLTRCLGGVDTFSILIYIPASLQTEIKMREFASGDARPSLLVSTSPITQPQMISVAAGQSALRISHIPGESCYLMSCQRICLLIHEHESVRTVTMHS